VDQYRTEEEQVEALRRWWDENGKSTIAAIVIAVSVGFGWQAWKANDQQQRENASDIYQAMLQAMGSGDASAEQGLVGIDLAEQLKADYSGSTYAQFAVLHLARLAVTNNDLSEAEAQLRWVLGKADRGSDVALVAQMRLARVMASSGDTDQALAILEEVGEGPYQASYAVARGDILLALGRDEGARAAYNQALMLAASSQGQLNMPALEQKLQSLNPVPARTIEAPVEVQAEVVEAAAPEIEVAVDGSADGLTDETADSREE
jgi:predicted negative regulator of RcsB-dependent stress response